MQQFGNHTKFSRKYKKHGKYRQLILYLYTYQTGVSLIFSGFISRHLSYMGRIGLCWIIIASCETPFP